MVFRTSLRTDEHFLINRLWETCVRGFILYVASANIILNVKTFHELQNVTWPLACKCICARGAIWVHLLVCRRQVKIGELEVAFHYFFSVL